MDNTSVSGQRLVDGCIFSPRKNTCLQERIVQILGKDDHSVPLRTD
uniref:Uncharacterized protein n=1 Tax=Anguilla anguilla TaxID=7936 RepID=A0A0E9WFM9_ANGAN